jgi:gliding motility-associated-like protein
MYVITATDRNNGCTGKDSVLIKIIYDLYVPNAFTPNGDGKNDVFGIPGMALYPDGKVSIFNRWDRWCILPPITAAGHGNGTMKGAALPSETFVYLIEIPGKETMKGTVTIVR